jgi:hypothetical protein
MKRFFFFLIVFSLIIYLGADIFSHSEQAFAFPSSYAEVALQSESALFNRDENLVLGQVTDVTPLEDVEFQPPRLYSCTLFRDVLGSFSDEYICDRSTSYRKVMDYNQHSGVVVDADYVPIYACVFHKPPKNFSSRYKGEVEFSVIYPEHSEYNNHTVLGAEESACARTLDKSRFVKPLRPNVVLHEPVEIKITPRKGAKFHLTYHFNYGVESDPFTDELRVPAPFKITKQSFYQFTELLWRKDVTEIDIVGPRSGESSASGGTFGDWGRWTSEVQFCPPWSWARGFSMQVEAKLGSGKDDTALNNVRLSCFDFKGQEVGDIETFKPFINWGEWGRKTVCPKGEYFISAQLKVEPRQGKGDDTAANAVRFVCTKGKLLESNNGERWGEWYGVPWQRRGAAICGIRGKIESPQGSGDNTALNNLKVYYCQNIFVPH